MVAGFINKNTLKFCSLSFILVTHLLHIFSLSRKKENTFVLDFENGFPDETLRLTTTLLVLFSPLW